GPDAGREVDLRHGHRGAAAAVPARRGRRGGEGAAGGGGTAGRRCRGRLERRAVVHGYRVAQGRRVDAHPAGQAAAGRAGLVGAGGGGPAAGGPGRGRAQGGPPTSGPGGWGPGGWRGGGVDELERMLDLVIAGALDAAEINRRLDTAERLLSEVPEEERAPLRVRMQTIRSAVALGTQAHEVLAAMPEGWRLA